MLPSIMIGIPCPMQGGFRPFDMALSALQTRCPELRVFYSMTGVLPGARNRIVRKALQVEAEYVWFLDDDQPFFPGTDAEPSDLEKLLAHRVEAVLPLSCRRGAPFLPLLYDDIHEDGWIARQRYLTDDESGLIPIAGAGLAGLLITTTALRRIGSDGWFEFVHPPDNFDDYCEDLSFYRKFPAAGLQLYCDLDVRFGHAVTCAAYIVKQQGHWVTVLADHEPFVAFPQPVHPLSVAPRERPKPMLVT